MKAVRENVVAISSVSAASMCEKVLGRVVPMGLILPCEIDDGPRRWDVMACILDALA